jgi:colanic acid/amylovoran biosynthesis glycosyltransferase
MIYGSGEMKDYLEQMISEFSLVNQVKLMGSISQQDLRAVMSKSDIFLYPGITYNGRAENQGLVIQEAQVMELPVIVSDAGGMSEGMIDGQTGYVIPEGNILLFVDAIEKLAKDPELRAKMGAAGRRFVQTSYSIQHLNDQLLQIYSLNPNFHT